MSILNKNSHWSRIKLTFLFGGILFLGLFLAFILTSLFVMTLVRARILILPASRLAADQHIALLFWSFLISLLVGLILALIIGRIVSNPIDIVTKAADALASGEYSTRIRFKKFYSRQPSLQRLAQSFNTLAEELEGTEMLRSDFINDFSHEFKTPIVSITGFAGLLRQGGLSREVQQDYLEIIENESRRLANMATNVLLLTRVENQTILSDVSSFNVSEQLRNCILLLEDKWTRKNLDIDLDLPDYTLQGNEELLSHVWLNLLDNAVKFTPEDGRISVSVKEYRQKLYVTVSNTGSTISKADQQRIYQKFYQADRSHAVQGNGIGLAIVKQVIRLHNGEVSVFSGQNITRFTVVLPH